MFCEICLTLTHLSLKQVVFGVFFFLTYWINQTQKYYKEENIKKFTVKLKDGNE